MTQKEDKVENSPESWVHLCCSLDHVWAQTCSFSFYECKAWLGSGIRHVLGEGAWVYPAPRCQFKHTSPWVLCSAWWVPLFHQANSDGPVLPSWAAGMWLVCGGRHCRCEHTPRTSSSSALQTSTWYVPWGQMYVVPKPIHHIRRGKSL